MAALHAAAALSPLHANALLLEQLHRLGLLPDHELRVGARQDVLLPRGGAHVLPPLPPSIEAAAAAALRNPAYFAAPAAPGSGVSAAAARCGAAFWLAAGILRAAGAPPELAESAGALAGAVGGGRIPAAGALETALADLAAQQLVPAGLPLLLAQPPHQLQAAAGGGPLVLSLLLFLTDAAIARGAGTPVEPRPARDAGGDGDAEAVAGDTGDEEEDEEEEEWLADEASGGAPARPPAAPADAAAAAAAAAAEEGLLPPIAPAVSPRQWRAECARVRGALEALDQQHGAPPLEEDVVHRHSRGAALAAQSDDAGSRGWGADATWSLPPPPHASARMDEQGVPPAGAGGSTTTASGARQTQQQQQPPSGQWRAHLAALQACMTAAAAAAPAAAAAAAGRRAGSTLGGADSHQGARGVTMHAALTQLARSGTAATDAQRQGEARLDAQIRAAGAAAGAGAGAEPGAATATAIAGSTAAARQPPPAHPHLLLLLHEYREAHSRVQDVTAAHAAAQGRVAALTATCHLLGEQVEETNDAIATQTAALSSTGRLQTLRVALAALRADSAALDVRVGLLSHSVMQGRLHEAALARRALLQPRPPGGWAAAARRGHDLDADLDFLDASL